MIVANAGPMQEEDFTELEALGLPSVVRAALVAAGVEPSRPSGAEPVRPGETAAPLAAATARALPARVAAVSGDELSLLGPGVPARGALRGALAALPPLERPTVGDWVLARPEGDRAWVTEVLPRASLLARKAAGRATEAQALAANVDVLFIVSAVGADLAARRIERFVVLARHGGVTPVVVLNKIDLDPDAAATCRELSRRLGGAEVIGTSALGPDVAAALGPWLAPRTTVAFVGSSGVGKSTLVNALCGEDRQATRAARAADDKGRHTTTRRELVVAPGGFLLVDTPGLREVALWADEDAVADAFEDVEDVAARCRFRDCRHEGEPGCAVARAVAEGSLDAERLASRRDLAREVADLARRADPRAALEAKGRAKALSRAVRQHLRVKGRK